MWRVDNEEKKLVLREAVILRRNALTSQESLLLSRAIQARALQLPAYQRSSSVALYSAIQNEVSTEEIFENALASGRRIFYPRIGAEGACCEFVAVSSKADLRIGHYGILEPAGAGRLSQEDCANLIMFVPGVAFDRSGNRLGRGRGWYDRMLTWLGGTAMVGALAYQFQVVEKVPIDRWDRRVQFIVTESQVIDCGAAIFATGRVPQ